MLCIILHYFIVICLFFQTKLFQEYYQTVKNLGPDQARPESKLFAKVISGCKNNVVDNIILMS